MTEIKETQNPSGSPALEKATGEVEAALRRLRRLALEEKAKKYAATNADRNRSNGTNVRDESF